ncbi:MAG: DedA family protein [bacterium]|nr:DedA family protein [bacterium]
MTETAGTAELTGIAKWTVDVMEWMGSFGIALLVAAENLFPPIPSEIILPLAGFTASLGSFHLWEAIAWATLGSVVGAMALYYVGFALGRERTRKLMGALPLVNPRDVARTEAWFDKHGTWTVLFGRLIPIFRSLISIPAGVTRMPLPKFIGLTLVGSLVWNTILVGAGYLLGENWHAVEPALDWLKYVVVAVVVAGVVWFVVSHLRSRRAGVRGDSDDAEMAAVDSEGMDADRTGDVPGMVVADEAAEMPGEPGREPATDSKGYPQAP